MRPLIRASSRLFWSASARWYPTRPSLAHHNSGNGASVETWLREHATSHRIEGSELTYTLPWHTPVRERAQFAARLQARLEEQGWISADAVARCLRQTAESGHVPNQLWYLYVLESWLRHENAMQPQTSRMYSLT